METTHRTTNPSEARTLSADCTRGQTAVTHAPWFPAWVERRDAKGDGREVVWAVGGAGGSRSSGYERPASIVPATLDSGRHVAREQEAPLVGAVFDPEAEVFAVRPAGECPRSLLLRDGIVFVQRWREALLCRFEGECASVRSLVSGHTPTGAPLQRPHLALVPLGAVGGKGEASTLVGVAAVFPVGTNAEVREAVQALLSRVEKVKLGRLGVWKLVPLRAGAQHRADLQWDAWVAWPGGATHWASVTPVVFDRHPKAKGAERAWKEVTQMFARACIAAGFPAPRAVVPGQTSAHVGVPAAHCFPMLTRKDGGARRHSHVALVFDRPVIGPVLIGAGRYRGYGICRPVEVP